MVSQEEQSACDLCHMRKGEEVITSTNGRGALIIATPTKCATTTLEAVARRNMRGAHPDLFRVMDWDRPRRQHRMALPPQREDDPVWASAERFLFVRNPYRRYMSIYTYLSAPQNYSQWGARQIQGREWGGHDESKVINDSKMSFRRFLKFLANQRISAENAADNRTNQHSKPRPDFLTGAAYKSPWVWTDSLTQSRDMLRDQPRVGNGLRQKPRVKLLRMETLWKDLEELSDIYGWGGRVNLDPTIHANRSTAYGERGPDPSSKKFWGGIEHARGVFDGSLFLPEEVVWEEGCSCAACLIGVAGEAVTLGYA